MDEDDKRARDEAFEGSGDHSHLEAPRGQESVRRVYALPQEMVDRIVEFQREKGLPSEVEAARRLLDEALKRRDNSRRIAMRLHTKFRETKFLSDAARDVLAGHPLVSKIEFGEGFVIVYLINGDVITAAEMGIIMAQDKHKERIFTIDRMGRLEDDEIPF